MALDTASAYKAFTGSTIADSVVTSAIAAAQAAMERYCGRDAGGFESATVTEYFDGTGRDHLQLTQWPITSITSVSYRTGKSSWSAIEASTYDVTTRGRLYLLGCVPSWDGMDSVFSEGTQNWKVVYVGGYSSLPADLVNVCRKITTSLLESRNADPALQSESVGAYSWTAGSADEQAAKWGGMLDPFRLGVP